jgi:hypothetical protein
MTAWGAGKIALKLAKTVLTSSKPRKRCRGAHPRGSWANVTLLDAVNFSWYHPGRPVRRWRPELTQLPVATKEG